MAPDLGNDIRMPRTIWKGALNFGLVNVPVGLYSATQDKAIHFNQFEEGTSDRIRYKKVNERTGAEVPAAKIVKGFDLGGGEYVLLTDEEIDAAEPEKSKLIEITDFVDLDQIDPVYYRSTYYLAPEGEAANKAYALLRQVMRRANKVAIGTVVMRNKEYPVAIRPDDEVLKLRDTGISYLAVAGRLGLNRAVDAQAGFVRALRRQPDEERAQLVQRESARLDALEVRVRSRDAEEPEKMNRRLVALEKLREAIR